MGRGLGLAVALCAAARVTAWDMDGSVIIGTEANFDEIISASSFSLVEFYAPWCGHCKELAPEYAAAADTLADKGSAVKLIKVDATEQEKLASRYSVDAYPSLMWFAGDRPAVEFTGGRTAADIVVWVTKKSGPNPIPITSIEEADAAKKETPTAAFGFFDSQEGAEIKAYNEAALLSDLTFYIVTDTEVAAHLKATEFPSLVFTSEGDEADVTFDKEWDATTVSEWCIGSSVPLVIEFTDQSASKIFDGPLKVHLILFVKKSSDKFETVVNDMKTSAASFRGRLLYVYVDADKDDNGRILEFFGLSKDDTPAYRIINLEGEMTKYAPPSTDTTADVLSAFSASYFDGSIKAHLKSQTAPDDWDAKSVKVLVSSNFEQVALDDSKDVLVEFYAPWCGHCKQLTPIFDELGDAYEHDASVVIAKMDATENELAGIAIESFPTIYLFRKGAKATSENPSDVKSLYTVYEGERELGPFLEYMQVETGVTGRRKGQEAATEGSEDDTGGGQGHEEL
eukprot:m.64872 g.64872  ORF g.64872 m.64872 type:complete len:512 (-) comp17923_c0_seq1:156-1691(-)